MNGIIILPGVIALGLLDLPVHFPDQTGVVRMNLFDWLQVAVYLSILLVLVKPLGLYMARIYQGERTFLSPILAPVERFFYRLAGVKSDVEMGWKTYASALLLFNLIGFPFLYLLLRLQHLLPLNPQDLGSVSPDLAFNTAVSFTTNTNWQSYGGETTLSYLTQMFGLTVQNFLSAATGMSVLIALIKGIARHTTHKLGNFWVDLTRSTLYILLPLAIILAIALVSQGVVQSFHSYPVAKVLDQAAGPVTQTLPLGPVASQVAIKQLGTNGGGYFNVNSAHPFENPTPFSNFLEMLAILLIPAALTYTYGKMIGDTRQGWAILVAMTLVLVAMAGIAIWAESQGNPMFTSLGIDPSSGNMEGKGGAVRHNQFSFMGDCDHCRIEWLSEFNARFIHSDRGVGTDVVDAAWARLFSVASAQACMACWPLFSSPSSYPG